MNENLLQEVEPGVLKIAGIEAGPDSIKYEGSTYYRFMDLFYIRNKNLDELTPEQVNNLCRARAKFPASISAVNDNVRTIFRTLVDTIGPSSLLEIGAGRSPIYGENDREPEHYILADADSEVVAHHRNLGNNCYKFSQDICELPNFDNFFEMAIAVFVLHFPFHGKQLLELYRRTKASGIIVANIYRRDAASKHALACEIKDTGFKILIVQDSENLCRDHEYWIIGREDKYIQSCAAALEEIINRNN